MGFAMDLSAPIPATKARAKRQWVWIDETVYDAELRKFKRFHREHPEVLAALVGIGLDVLGSPEHQLHKPRIGINLLWEILRLNLGRQGSHLGLSNNLKPFYARMMRERYIEFRDAMEVRLQFSAMKKRRTRSLVQVRVEGV